MQVQMTNSNVDTVTTGHNSGVISQQRHCIEPSLIDWLIALSILCIMQSVNASIVIIYGTTKSVIKSRGQ